MYILIADKINFKPNLPAPKKEIMNRMPVGLLNKVIITYEKVSLLSNRTENLIVMQNSTCFWQNLKKQCFYWFSSSQVTTCLVYRAKQAHILLQVEVHPNISSSRILCYMS